MFSLIFVNRDFLKLKTKKEGRTSEDSYGLKRNDTKELTLNSPNPQVSSRVSEDPVEHYLDVAKSSSEN